MAGDLTTPAAAALLGVHSDTLARWADEGKVPHWRTPAGHRRFRQADLEAIRSTDPATRTDKAAS